MNDELDEDFDDLLFCAVLLLLQNENRSVRDTLSIQEIRNRNGNLRRRSIVSPSCSPFVVLFNSGQDDALITLTGFNHHAFQLLLNLFRPLFDSHSP